MVLILLVIVALFVATVQWRAYQREARAREATPPVGQILDIDGVKVHAKVMGEGPDLVMIHGASGNLRDFTFDFAERLTDRYRVVLFDRPGLGWTDRLPGYGGAWNNDAEPPQAQAALLQKAADALDVKNPIVLGHSYGGAVALAWGLSRPEDTAALVLVSGVSEPWPGGLGWLYTVTGSTLGSALFIPLVTAFAPKSLVKASVDAIFAPQKPPEGYTRYIGAGLTLRRESTRANAQQVNSLLPQIVEMQAQYETLSLPVEAVHGDTDNIVPLHIHSQPLMDDLPNGNLTVLEGVGHMPHHADPQAVEDAIDRAATRAGLRPDA